MLQLLQFRVVFIISLARSFIPVWVVRRKSSFTKILVDLFTEKVFFDKINYNYLFLIVQFAEVILTRWNTMVNWRLI